MQLADLDQSEAVAELENAIKWAENNRAKTVPLLKEITALLPERGFVREFSYQVPGTVNLLVQFDTNREGAYFLDYLNDAEWVQEAELEKMEARDPEDKDVEAGIEFVPRYDVNYKIHIDRTKIAEFPPTNREGMIHEWETVAQPENDCRSVRYCGGPYFGRVLLSFFCIPRKVELE